MYHMIFRSANHDSIFFGNFLIFIFIGRACAEQADITTYLAIWLEANGKTQMSQFFLTDEGIVFCTCPYCAC